MVDRRAFLKHAPTPYMKPPLVPTDLNRLMKIVLRSEYRGFLPIETLSVGKTQRYEPLKEVSLFLKQVREAIAAT